MIKGSRARKCHKCGKIVAWSIPAKNTVTGPLIFRTATMKLNDDYGGHDGKGYVCKDCAAARKGDTQ